MARLEEIGRGKDLSGRTLKDYVRFFKARFPENVKKGLGDYPYAESYAREWADRFGRRSEWYSADYDSRKVMVKINPNKYGKNIYAVNPKFMASYKKRLRKVV